MKIQISKSNIIILFYVLFMAQNIVNGYFLVLGDTEETLFLLCWMGNALIAVCLLTWKKIVGSLMNPYIVFLLSLYIFSYGQAFLKSIGVSHDSFDLYTQYTNEELLFSHYFTVISISFLHLGALWSQRKRENFVLENKDIMDTNLKKSIKIVAWILFLTSSFFYFESAFQNAIQSIKFGYMSLYNYDNVALREMSLLDNVILTLKMLFIPSIFLLLIVYKRNNLIRVSIVILIILAVGLNFAAGTRTGAAALLISFVILWHKQIKAFKGLKFLNIFVGALLLLVLFNTFGDIRGVTDRNLNTIFETFKNNIFNQNPILISLGEMGGSMFPLLEVIELAKDQVAYKFGLTYISSLFAVFPSFLVGDIIPRVSLADWLMSTLNMSYGPGFSLLAEAYLNFSWLGSTFMFILGYIFARLLNPKKIQNDYFIIKSTLSCVFLYFIITAGRGDTLLIVRYEVFYVLIPFLMIYVVNMYFKERVKNVKRIFTN